MTQAVLKSARSTVISVARDFSSGITLYDGRQFTIDEGLPVHLANVQYLPRYTLEQFDDISAGDCFLTNSPYAGNTHHADYTYHAPVFVDDEPLFWAISRAHQADVGAPIPTTYVADGETLYEEGPHLPSVRIQEDYEDRDDVVRMCKLNIREGEDQWYGDYLAQVAAVRQGERRIQSVCEEYGVETVKAFASEWLAYGERKMRSEVADLPDETVEHTARYDPIPAAPEGIPIHAEVDIRPDEERIVVDVTDNPANLDAGFNLSEATTVAAVYGGVFNNLDPDLPHNQGSISRIDVVMDEGNVVGVPEFPVGTSVATTNVCDVLFNAVQAAFGQLGEPHGIAEGTSGMTPTLATISGEDYRDGSSYINQILHVAGGGPGMYGHDGWLTYGIPVTNGVIYRDSVEVDESKYPILVERNHLTRDTEGAGAYRGAPGAVSEYGPRGAEIDVAFFANNCVFPPQGINGGEAATRSNALKRTADGDLVETDRTGVVSISPGETVIGRVAGGGGYGSPLDREPERVRDDVAAGFVSTERARDTYGVVVKGQGYDATLDEAATAALRERLSRAAPPDSPRGDERPGEPDEGRGDGE